MAKISELLPEDKMLLPLAIEKLVDCAYNCALDHGWWDEPRSVGDCIALMHSELSELLERYRSNPATPDEHCPEFKNCEIELADLLIRAFDFAGRHQYRLGEALLAKMLFNETRPRKHGKQF